MKMELKAYECEKCGSTILIPSKDSGKTRTCAFCGTEYKEISDDDNLGLGVAHLENGSYSFAESSFRKYVESHPTDYRGHLGLLLVEYCKGQVNGISAYNSELSIVSKNAPPQVIAKIDKLIESYQEFNRKIIINQLPFVDQGIATKKLSHNVGMRTEPERRILLEAYTELYDIVDDVLTHPSKINEHVDEYITIRVSNIEKRYDSKIGELKEEIKKLENDIKTAKRNRRVRFIKHFFFGILIGALCTLILYFPVCWLFSSAINRYAPKKVFVIGLFVISVIAVWYKYSSESDEQNNSSNEYDIQNRKERIKATNEQIKKQKEQCKNETSIIRSTRHDEVAKSKQYYENIKQYLSSSISMLKPAKELFESLIKDIQA